MKFRWCGWCMTGGVVLFLIGVSQAMAQTPSVSEAPTYTTWFQVLLGLVLALIGAYAKGLNNRLTSVEKQAEYRRQEITTLRERVISEYHNKSDIAAMHADLRSLIAAVHSRLDRLGYPASRSRLHQDDGA